MITTAKELKEILKDVDDDATFIFSVDFSDKDTPEEEFDRRLVSDFAEISVERNYPGRVIFTMFDMNKNYD